MSRDIAKSFYTRRLGDPAEGYISDADARASVDVIYDDMLGAVLPVTWKSANVSAWNHGEFADDWSVVSQVEALGLNVVSIPVRVAATDINDSRPAVDPAHLARALAIAELLPPGMLVIAEPYPWVENGNQSETLWTPDDVDEWFAHWTAACIEVAEAFPQAAMVYLGANMVSLEAGHDAKWIALANAVRAVTSAEISYRCNWWHESARRDALMSWSFLDHLDVISVAAYFELTTSRNPTRDEVRKSFSATSVWDRRQNVGLDLEMLATAHNKDIFLGELNCGRCEFALLAPWNPVVSTTANAAIQEYLFGVYVEMLAPKPWFRGFSVFNIGDFGDSQYRLTPAAVDYIASIPKAAGGAP